MYMWVALAVFCSVYNFVLSEGPCKLTEETCLQNFNTLVFSKINYAKVVKGDPQLGIESLDPIHHDLIEGNLSILKYSIADSYTRGLKNCKANSQKIKVKDDILTFHVDILCPEFDMKGKYEISGRLIIIPVEGKGDFYMNTHQYNISIDAEMKIAPGKDGKNYMTVKNFKQVSDPLGSIKFDFQNLFNGQKDLADAVLKFANENWYEVAKEVQDPIFNAHARKLIGNVNKYLKKMPLDDVVTL